MQRQMFQIKEKSLKEMASSIANEVANKIYYEFLFARYLPEIKAIEKGDVTALEGKEAKNYLKRKIISAE